MRETEPLLVRSHDEDGRGADPRTPSRSIQERSDAAPQLHTLTWMQRLRVLVVEYGAIGLVVHTVLSLALLALVYTCISNGVDVSALLAAIGITNSAHGSTAHAAGTFVLAYAVFKLLAPVRIPITFAVTPLVLRLVRRHGYMLPPASPASCASAASTPRRVEQLV